MDDYKAWFQAYSLLEPNKLMRDSDVLKAVDLDELDPAFIEKRIQQTSPATPLINRFCHSCQETFDNWPTVGRSSQMTHESSPSDFPDEKGWETAVARHCTTFEIEGGMRAGCRFCTFLLQGLKDTELLEIFRKVETRLYHLGEDGRASISIQDWAQNPIQIIWLNLPGKICTHCNSGIAIASKFSSSFLPATGTLLGSSDCYDEPSDIFTAANKWMSTCLAEHELCKSDGTVLPTRLIQVSSSPPRLVISSDLKSRPRYLTLSHSWGGHDIIKLTSATLDSFQMALPVDELSQIFQDAIEIARKMGIDYLWVDSLCILQDSETDWEQESALMSSVYGQTSCTIAASSARHSGEGMFRKLPNYSGGFRARITDGGQKRVQDFRTRDVYKRSVLETHLGSRAWALQEKLLAPRTMHFGERGAFWECRTTLASEYLPEGMPRELMTPLVRRNKFFKWLYQWPMIVRLYSAGNLTFGKDKLTALAGVARLVFEETGDEYLAGLWKSQFEEQLCWRRWKSDPAGTRPPWRAPTWSWASIDGEVAWMPLQKGKLETKYAHVIDAQTTKRGIDPFGQVTSGVVRIACSGMLVGHIALSQDLLKQVPKETSTKVRLSGDTNREYSILLDYLDDAALSRNLPLYLLPILGGETGLGRRRDKDSDEYDREMMVEGVVLRAACGGKSEFSRIGAFNYYKGNWVSTAAYRTGEELYEPFLHLLQEQGAAVAEEICPPETVEDPGHPDHRYTITIT